MGYNFSVKGYYTIKHSEKKYPWPCPSEPNRTITLFNDDVLTGDGGKNTYMKHTGLGCFGIIVPEEDLIEHKKTVNMRLL